MLQPLTDTAQWPAQPTLSGVTSSTCKHGTEIRAAGCQHHPVSFHLHGLGHNHHIAQEPLAGETPEKTKVISELPVRLKATSPQPQKNGRSTITDTAPELLPNPRGRFSNASVPAPVLCLPTQQSLNPPEAAALPVLLLSQGKKTWKPNEAYMLLKEQRTSSSFTSQTSRAWRRQRRA